MSPVPHYLENHSVFSIIVCSLPYQFQKAEGQSCQKALVAGDIAC